MSDAKRYPDNWPLIATNVKNVAAWRCVRCGHPHEGPDQIIPCDERCDESRHLGTGEGWHVLTVHHLDGDPSNCRWWNLAALCQRCHLHIQCKVVMDRVWLFEHSEWFKPYVAGRYAYARGLDDEREFVLEHLDHLLSEPA